jgi:hypothetical protein
MSGSIFEISVSASVSHGAEKTLGLMLACCLSACSAAESTPGESLAVSADAIVAGQPPLEEDFAYPGADKIQAEHGIAVSRGDGHLLFVDCNSGTDLIETWSTIADLQCFGLRGQTGWLTLNIPDVYLVKAGSQALKATVDPGGQPRTVNVPINTWVPLGTAVDGVPAGLVALETAN